MWYRLKNEVDSSVMGDFPQTSEYLNEAKDFLYDVTDLLFTDHLIRNYNVNYIKLKSKAKFTDFICCLKHQSSGLIISEKVFNILSDYNIYNVKFYDTILKKGKVEKKYYFMRLAGNLTNYVNFEESVFRTYKDGKVVSEFTCFNIIDYKKRKFEQYKVSVIDPIYAHEIYFQPELYTLNYDCIFLGELATTSILINEKLKTRLESENLKGMVIEPYELIKN